MGRNIFICLPYRVAILNDAVFVMCLGSEEPDTFIKLCRDRRKLVIRWSNTHEGRIMRPSKSDLAIQSIAVRIVSIASSGGARGETEDRQGSCRAHFRLGVMESQGGQDETIWKTVISINRLSSAFAWTTPVLYSRVAPCLAKTGKTRRFQQSS